MYCININQRGGDKVGRAASTVKISGMGNLCTDGGWFAIPRPDIYNDSLLDFGSVRQALRTLIFLYKFLFALPLLCENEAHTRSMS